MEDAFWILFWLCLCWLCVFASCILWFIIMVLFAMVCFIVFICQHKHRHQRYTIALNPMIIFLYTITNKIQLNQDHKLQSIALSSNLFCVVNQFNQITRYQYHAPITALWFILWLWHGTKAFPKSRLGFEVQKQFQWLINSG